MTEYEINQYENEQLSFLNDKSWEKDRGAAQCERRKEEKEEEE